MPHKFIFYFFQFTFDIFLIYLDTVIIFTIHKDAYIVFTHTKYQLIATKGTKVTNYKWHVCNANSVTKKSSLFNCLPRLQVPYKTISMGMYTDAFVSKYQMNTVVHEQICKCFMSNTFRRRRRTSQWQCRTQLPASALSSARGRGPIRAVAVSPSLSELSLTFPVDEELLLSLSLSAFHW